MTSASADDSKDTVLVVDDDEHTRTALQRGLRRLGYEVMIASDGEEGLASALEARPSVIFTDIRMPKMDGHTLLRRLARHDLDSAVIVMSAAGTMDDVVDVLRGGAVDYLSKPWSPSELTAAVGRAVEIHAQRRERRRPSGTIVEVAPEATPAQVDSAFAGILEQLRRGEITVPAVGPIVAALRQLLRRPDARAEEVSALIERDPALATSVLKISSSSLYLRAGRGSDVKTAVARIGFRQIQSMVETIFVRGCYRVRDPRYATIQARIWRHSVARAISMRALADLLAMSAQLEPEKAYTCGLLCDVGASFLLWLASERKASSGAQVIASPEQLLPSLRAQHQEVGQLVLSSWALEADVALVAGAHHDTAPPAPHNLYWSLSVVATELTRWLAPEGDVTGSGDHDRAVVERCSAELKIGSTAIQRMKDALILELEEVLETLP